MDCEGTGDEKGFEEWSRLVSSSGKEEGIIG